MYTGASFLHREIKSLETKLEADRLEAAVDRRQMQATLNAILEDLGSLKARRWW
jgi:hypothetical protein